MIYEIEQIAARLDELFAPLESNGVTGLRLVRYDDASHVADAIKRVQDELGERLPLEFVRFINEFDLGEFALTQAWFGSGGEYCAHLLALNQPDEYGGKWWQGSERPRGSFGRRL